MSQPVSWNSPGPTPQSGHVPVAAVMSSPPLYDGRLFILYWIEDRSSLSPPSERDPCSDSEQAIQSRTIPIFLGMVRSFTAAVSSPSDTYSVKEPLRRSTSSEEWNPAMASWLCWACGCRFAADRAVPPLTHGPAAGAGPAGHKRGRASTPCHTSPLPSTMSGACSTLLKEKDIVAGRRPLADGDRVIAYSTFPFARQVNGEQPAFRARKGTIPA